jgi:hypothetical protein
VEKLVHCRGVHVSVECHRHPKHIQRAIEVKIPPRQLGGACDVPKSLASRAGVDRSKAGNPK